MNYTIRVVVSEVERPAQQGQTVVIVHGTYRSRPVSFPCEVRYAADMYDALGRGEEVIANVERWQLEGQGV